SMFAVSGIANVMFLGGWSLGLPWEMTDLASAMLGNTWGTIVGNLINVVVFIFKCWFLVFVMMWVRWRLPRLRIDQVMMMCLKYLIPIGCTLLLGVSLWHLILQSFSWGGLVLENFKCVMFAVCMAGLALVIKQWITWASSTPGTGMPGMWRM